MDSQIQISKSEEFMLKQRGYKLLKTLAKGTYSKVYLAEYKSVNEKYTSRQLACKVIDISNESTEFIQKYLPRELKILVKVNHPHIILVHSIFYLKEKYFIFMRHAENGDLLNFILEKGAISEGQSRVWTRQLCLALQYLHHMEIAHRDLKCENALITFNYNLKIADFGFSRYVIDADGNNISSNTYCGSLSYTAPEILKGVPYFPKIADIWSLGVVVYVMLNKAMPFDETSFSRLLQLQLKKKWQIRSIIDDHISQQLKNLLTHILEPDINKRWKIDQILASEWFTMEPKFKQLNAAEAEAIIQANEERLKYIEYLRKKTTSY